MNKTCALALITSLCMIRSAPAWAACKLETAVLPVTMMSGQPTVPALINDTPVKLVLDSGSFFSMLTPTAAAKLNLSRTAIPMTLEGVSGSAQAYSTVVGAFTIAGVPLHHVDFLVGGSSITETAGLLGQNVLGMTDVEYDLGEGVMRLALPVGDGCGSFNLAYWTENGQSVVLPLEARDSQTDQTRGEIYVNGVKLMAAFDTGSGASVISRKAAERAGVKTTDPSVRAMPPTYGIGNHPIQQWIGRFSSVKIGEENIQNTPLYIMDSDLQGIDVLIGADFFMSHRIYVSNYRRKLYFTYNGGPIFAAAKTVIKDAPDAATQETTAAEVATPTTADGFSRRGAIRRQRGDLTGAIADFSQAITLAPHQPDYRRQRAEALLDKGDPKAALGDLDVAVTWAADDATGWLARAGTRLVTGDKAGAAADLDHASQMLSQNADDRRQIADIDLGLGRMDDAIAQLNLWINSHRDDPLRATAYNARCWTRALSGKGLDLALSDCNRALAIDPTMGAALDSRGLVELRLGELDAAISDYGANLAHDPKAASSLYGRGLAELQHGQTKQGQADVSAAAALAPGLAKEWEGYGIAAPVTATKAGAATTSAKS